MERDKTKTKRPSRLRAALAAVSMGIFLVASGCGGGGGGGGSKPAAGTPGDGGAAQKTAVLFSGTVRLSGASAGAGRVARQDLPAVPGARVEVAADLDGDGAFSSDERFGATADDQGFFSVAVPAEGPVGRVRVRVGKAGFSEFVREIGDLEGPVQLAPLLSEGDVQTIDLGQVASGPARGGRVALLGDETVTVQLVRSRETGRRAARAFVGSAAPAPGSDPVLTSVTFPLRGLRISADAPPRLYANVAYLDTANDPDVMPGGFRAEGEGDTAVDVLTSYGASQIKLYDASGQELLTDPADRDREVEIKIAIPVEAYASLEDENPDTEAVEIPLFYFDEEAGTWKLHKTVDGGPAYGVLTDQFGNRLTRSDLLALQTTGVDAAGATVPDPQYAPPGVDPADVVVYGVGKVHHFTTWNCDRSGRSSSFHAEFRDKNGNPLKADFRIRRKSGGTSADTGRPDRTGRVNVHIDYDRNADSLVKKLLDRGRSPEERSWILWTVQHGNDPRAKQALIEALRRYAENLRDDIAAEGSDLARGLRAIFNNKLIQDAFISTDGLDCAKTPDLCNGVLGAAVETVNQSEAGQKAVAVLMQIAVDAYNPGSMDFDYFVNTGVGLLDATVEMEGIKDAKGDMEQVYNGVKKVKELAEKVKEARKLRLNGDAGWQAYWDAAKEFKEALAEVKGVASVIGRRAGRAATRRANLTVVAEPEPATDTPEEREEAAAWMERKIVLEAEDLGGAFFGASRLSRYEWGHVEGGVFVVSGPPAQMPAGGGDVAVLEIFDGTDWVAVPGESDLGVSADFVPIPPVTSFGNGSPDRPVVNLGTWTFDLEPNVEVTGNLKIKGTDKPAANAVVVVEGTEFRPDADGRVSGTLTAFVSSVGVQVPGAYWSSVAVAGGKVDLGTIEVPEAVRWENPAWRFDALRGEPLQVDPQAVSVSGDPVAYTFRLYRSYWGMHQGEDPLDETAVAPYDVPTDTVGEYYLLVTAEVNGVESTRGYEIGVRNNPPQIGNITVSPASPGVGDEIRVAVTVTDPDGDDDVSWRGLEGWCEDGNGGGYRLRFLEEGGEWVARTADQWELYRAPVASLACTVRVRAYDRLWSGAEREADFVLAQSRVAPEVRWSALAESYTLACWQYDPDGECQLFVRPGYSVDFADRNGDLDRYELDCGAGEEPVTGENPITAPCLFPEPGTYTVTYAAVDAGGGRGEVTTKVTVLHPLRLDVTFPEGLAVGADEEDGAAVIELPARAEAAPTLGVSLASDNGPDGYEEGAGTITSARYQLTYRPGAGWWSQTLGWGDLPVGGVSVPLTKPGTYSLTVWASDAKGMAGSFSRVFRVTAPFDVALRINGQTPREFATSGRPWVKEDETVSFAVEDAVAPAEGWDPGFTWTVDGEDQGLVTTARTFQAAFAPGEHTVAVAVRNAADATDREVVREVTFPVYAEHAVAFRTSYDERVEGEVSAGDLYGVTIGVGPEVVGAAWSVLRMVDGTPMVSTGHRVLGGEDFTTRSFVFTEEGTYRIQVSVWDENGVVTTRSLDADLTVTAHPPEISSVTADPATVRPGGSATVTAVATDPDARPGETLEYEWYVNGAFQEGVTGPSLTRAFEREGVYRITVRVFDASGRMAEKTATLTAGYQPPQVTVTATPSSGVAPLSVAFAAEATDPDGTVTAYAWDVGADGSVEGTGAAFSHTFADPGTYAVRLTVTDDDGKTGVRETTVYVYDASSAVVTLEFRERRSDGLGPLYDFAAEDPMMHEEGGKEQVAWASPGDLGGMTLRPPASTMEFVGQGFLGPYREAWGNPELELYEVTEPGTYRVGMDRWGAAERTVTFPEAYACGYLLAGDWARPFGLYDEEQYTQQVLSLASRHQTVAGEARVLAILGSAVVTVGDWDKRCEPSYYGFVAGPGDLALTAETEIAAKPLAPAPDGYTLNHVSFDAGDGIVTSLSASSLATDGEGRYLVPVAPGVDLALEYGTFVNSRYWAVTVRIPAAEAAGAAVLEPDFSAIVTRGDLEVAGTVPGDTLRIEWESPTVRLYGNLPTDGGTGPVGDVLALSGDDTKVRLWYDGAGRNPGFYRTMAGGDLPTTLDLSAPGTAVDVDRLDVTVDRVAKTLTVDFGSAPDADACRVEVLATYSDESLTTYSYRDRRWAFWAPAGRTSYTLSYPIPEMVITFPDGGTETAPAIEALTEVRAQADCGRFDRGYPDLLRAVLEGGGEIEDLARQGILLEGVSREATWAP